MRFSTRALRTGAQVAVFAGAVVAAGCNSSNNTTPIPTLSTFTAPAVNGVAVTFNVAPGAPLGTSTTIASSASAPSGVPAPSALARQAQAIAGAVPVQYVSIQLSKPVPASLFLSEVFALTSALPATASYFAELDDPGATPPKLLTIAGTVGGGLVTFTNANGNGPGIQTLAANHVYVFQFYYIAGAGASPTPSPGPPGVLSASPSTLALYGTGSSNAGSVFVQETGYSGTFGESDTCAGVATVAPSNGTGPSTTFSVTGVAAGTCTATFTDSSGQHASAAITVTTTGFGVQSRARGGE